MPRTQSTQISDFPFHITARTPNRVNFPLPLVRVWEILSDELYWCSRKYDFEAISFVLMRNHFHLIAYSRTTPLGIVLNDLMRDSSLRMNLEANRINQNWGAVAYRTHIDNMHYFLNVYRYVYQNPVRSGICTRAEEYPYSTLNGKLGLSRLTIPILEDPILFSGNVQKNLDWLNELATDEEVSHVRHALKYRNLRIKKDSNQRVQFKPAKGPD